MDGEISCFSMALSMASWGSSWHGGWDPRKYTEREVVEAPSSSGPGAQNSSITFPIFDCSSNHRHQLSMEGVPGN